MIKSEDLYRKLEVIEERIKSCAAPDGVCPFDAEKVYIMLETALSYLPEAQEHGDA